MQLPKNIIRVPKPIKHFIAAIPHRTAVIAISVTVVVTGVTVASIAVRNNHNEAEKPITTTKGVKTTKDKKPDEPTVLIRNDDGSVSAVSQNDIAKNPSLLNKVITNPTESDYKSAGITQPPLQNTPTLSVESVCANASPSNPYNYHRNEDGANHDNDLYCPTVEVYCKAFPSANICTTIKPDAPNPSSWTSYKISTSTGNTVSSWVQVSPGGLRKCTRANFWFDKNGSTTPPDGWHLPIGILGFYHWWDAVPAEYSYCSEDKYQYTTHYILSEEDIYDGTRDGRVTIFTPYAATRKSYTFDTMYCTKYRVSWEALQRADKSWWSAYRVYKDTITASLISGKYTYNNDFCKQLFGGTTTIDTTTVNWTQFAPDEYLNIGKQTFSKNEDTTGGLTGSPPASQ